MVGVECRAYVNLFPGLVNQKVFHLAIVGKVSRGLYIFKILNSYSAMRY